MKNLILISLALVICSCSSLKRTIIYSSLAGGMVGATTGAILSPDKVSQGGNAVVWGVVGAGLAALTGYALYSDDPRNFKLKQMLKERKELPQNEMDIDLGGLQIRAELEKREAYKVPLKDLPKELKGKVNKQYLIKYQSKERYVKKGAKTYYIPAFDILEHSYDEKIERGENEQ